MNRQELANEIRRLKNKEKIPKKTLIRSEFTLQPVHQHLDIAFRKIKLKNEKWHQFVRFVLTPEKEWKYMYERLAILLKRHRDNIDDYFILRSGTTSNTMPDRMTDFIRFHKLYEEFFEIYLKIIRHIQVDYPVTDYTGQMIRGKINWQKTLLKSNSQFPLNFEMSTKYREFETPENILLYLSINWLNKEAVTLINEEFKEPLEDDEIQTLYNVESSTNRLIQNFPYKKIIKNSEKFSKLSPADKEITLLIENVKSRIRKGIIRNKRYLELLEWIEKLKDMSLELLSGNPTRFHIDSLYDLDTIYEAWIYLELVDFIKRKKHLDVKLTFKKSNEKYTFFEFNFEGQVIRVYYEKQFLKNGGEAWTRNHKPDYSVFINKKLIALFDAKNYSKFSEAGEGIDKMSAYMLNLDVGFGALIFPKIKKQVRYKFDKKDRKKRVLTYYQMEPIKPDSNNQTKEESMKEIFNEIINQI